MVATRVAAVLRADFNYLDLATVEETPSSRRQRLPYKCRLGSFVHDLRGGEYRLRFTAHPYSSNNIFSDSSLIFFGNLIPISRKYENVTN